MLDLIPRISVTRPVTVVTAFLVILVVGVIAYTRIPVQMMPSGWSPPYLWVWAPYADSTPLDTEARVLKPLEEQIATVPGIAEMSSTAKSDNATLSLEFHGSADMDEAYNAVSDRIERAMPQMPSEVKRVWIWRFDPTDEPVIWSGIQLPENTAGAPPVDVHNLVTHIIQKRLERVPGVGRVDVWGVGEPIVWIDFDRERLAAHNVDLVGLMGRLGTDNFQLASGSVHDRGQVRYVRALARFGSLDDIRNYPVAKDIRLADVADISQRAAASASINRIDGREGAGLAVNKESAANTVEVCDDIKQAFIELEQDPRLAGFHFPVFFDQGMLIEDSMDALKQSALEGGVLAIFVLILFLRDWRITALIAATIPASLLLTLTVMYFRGDSLNLLSMLGLMLAVGMVVDNAVVVVETIYRRRQAGQDPVSAAIDGTAEVILPITLSTLTSIVVFLPTILMTEDATFSFFLAELGLPVVYVQVGSLLITLLFTPLSTVWLTSDVRPDAKWISWLSNRVDRGVAWVLSHRLGTGVGMFVMLGFTIAVPMEAVGCGGDAESNLDDFVVRYEVPPAYTYEERLAVVKAFEALPEAHHDTWGVRVYRSQLNDSSRNGRLFVYLDDEAPGAIAREEVLEEVKRVMPDLPGVVTTVGWGDTPSGNESAIGIELAGEDTETLALLAVEAQRRIRALPIVTAVRNDVEAEGSEEIQLALRPAVTGARGVSAQSVAQLISFAMRGAPLPSFFQGERETRVFGRFSLEDRESVDALMAFQIGTPTGAEPLANLVDAKVGKGWGVIERKDRHTALGLTIELVPKTEKKAAYEQVEAALASMEWPDGYGVDRGADWEKELASNDAQYLALVLSMVFVFLIMGVLFESFLLPMTVIMTVPMALFGVYWALWATGTPFDSMAGVGVIILIGIVVNNGIVLIDVVGDLRAEGRTREDALREAVRIRLRPILMTALSAIMGVVPMAIGSDTFIGIPYAPMGRVILSGMCVATVLTLFFVPYLYTLLDDMRQASARWAAFWLPRGIAKGPS